MRLVTACLVQTSRLQQYISQVYLRGEALEEGEGNMLSGVDFGDCDKSVIGDRQQKKNSRCWVNRTCSYACMQTLVLMAKGSYPPYNHGSNRDSVAQHISYY